MTNAAGVEIEAIWATLLAKALEGKDVKELLSNVGSGGGAPATGAPAAGGAPAAAAAVEEKTEEPKPEEKEESDDDMVRPRSRRHSSPAHLLTVRKLFALRVLGYLTEHWPLHVPYLYYYLRHFPIACKATASHPNMLIRDRLCLLCKE